ncbi:N-acetylglucosamine kinase [Sphaerisporangium fuscum]|uniref:N-acetylglucosamine kinase n=1 Tax=Sphaerisporangium fuscum TaxID=2835868 RepID=UPI001BDC75B3|nr:BadF/BadG/BcrA/BcrD ATPase family protein [Sphaerisporangium fuscum]
MRAMESLVVGVDGGGTSTRCVIATLDGEIVARGHAGGANPRSVRDPAANLARALTEALSLIGPRFTPGDVVGGVFGLAGAGEAGRRQSHRMTGEAWHAAGLNGEPAVVPDIVVAFAGATPAASGTVVIAGTGAVAARIEDRRILRRCDGHGWLLGDRGSGVWIGRRAVQAALAAIDGTGPATALTGRVLPALRAAPPSSPAAASGDGEAESPEGDTALSAGAVSSSGGETGPPAGTTAPLAGDALSQAIISAVYEGEPARLGILSPVVESTAREGDPVALAIVEDAARHLVTTLEAVGEGARELPVVLAGSLLTHPTLVAGRVRESLAGRTVVPARDGAAGAAALALRAAVPAGGVPGAAEAAHRRLLAS